MAEVKIDIPGVGEVTAENAASERTLQQIVKLLGGPSGALNQGGGAGGGALGKSTEKASKGLKNVGEASEEATGAIGKMASAASSFVGGAFNALVAGVSSVVGALPAFGMEVLAGGNRLSDFAQHVPIVGGALSQLTGILDGQMNMYRELSSTGATFGNNMFEITRIAGEAAIPQKDFAELLTTQAESIRIFGNSVGDGAKNFARLSKEMRQSTAGKDLMAMGFTTQELNENLISYSELTQLSGRRQFMTQEQLISGSLEYSKELDKIAKLTGKSRKDIEAQQKAASLDIRRQMAIAEAGENLRDRLAQVSAVSPDLEAALVDMADGVANDPLTQQLMANNATFREQAAQVQNMTAEQAQQFMAGVARDGKEFAKTLGQAGVQGAISAGTTTGEYLKITGQLQKVQTTTEGTIDAEQGARDKLTTGLATFEETVNNVRGQVQAAIVDSGIFQDVADAVGEFIPTTEEAQEMFDKFSTSFKNDWLPTIKQGWQDFKNIDWARHKETLSSLWESFKTNFGKISTWFENNWPTWKANFEKIWTGVSTWWEEKWPGIKTKLEEMWGKATALYDDHIKPWIDKFAADPSAAFSELWTTIKDGMKTWVGNVFANFDYVAFGATLLLAMTKLNPFGALASTLIAGIVGFIGWDNIKSFLSLDELGNKVKEMWQNFKDGFMSMFDFEWEWPNFKKYLPKWLGGDGAKISDLWSGDSSSTGPTVENQSFTPDANTLSSDGTVETAMNTTGADIATKKLAESNSATNDTSNLLNIQIAELIEINRKSNKLISALSGNIQGSAVG